MDPKGNIHHIPDDVLSKLLEGAEQDYTAFQKRVKELNELEPIPESELERVRAMNRHERRAWYAKRRAKK